MFRIFMVFFISLSSTLAQSESPFSSQERRELTEARLAVEKIKAQMAISKTIVYQFEDQAVTFINPRGKDTTPATLYFDQEALDRLDRYQRLLGSDLVTLREIAQRRQIPVELAFFMMGPEAQNRLDPIHKLEEAYTTWSPSSLRANTVVYNRSFWSADVGPGSRSPFMVCELYAKNYLRKEFDAYLKVHRPVLTDTDKKILTNPSAQLLPLASPALGSTIHDYLFSVRGGFEAAMAYADMVANSLGYDTLQKRVEPLSMIKLWAYWLVFDPDDRVKLDRDPMALIAMINWGEPYFHHREAYSNLLLPAYTTAIVRAQQIMGAATIDTSKPVLPLELK